MKAQAKDAVALAMDWLAQLREEDGAGPPPGDNEPAIDSVPAVGDFGDFAPAGPPAREWDAAPRAGVFGDAAPATPPAGEWDAAPPGADREDVAAPAPSAVEWEFVAPAVPHAADREDARPAVPPAVEWGYVAPAAPSAFDWGYVAPAAPPAADWGGARPAAQTVTDFDDAGPAMQPAAGSWYAAAPPGTTSPGRAAMKASIEITERAAIGDELRIPLAWCEMGSCISHYADPAALGEADIRTRAIAAGWRVDALGRLACPPCQQGDSLFWTAHPVALWDRDRAVAMTALMAAAMREMTGADDAAGMQRGAPVGREASAPLGRERVAAPGGEQGPVPGGEPAAVPGPRPEMARQPGRGRHRGHPDRA